MRIVFLIAYVISMQLCMAQKTGVVLSDKSGWHKIGETSVAFDHDTDYIAVVGADKFAQIKIRIGNAPVHLRAIDLIFEAGDVQSVKVERDLKAAGESEVVVIKGGERRIKNVRFIYRTVSDSKEKKARVELWGLKTNTDRGKPK